jgi:uncharacterized membrane protein YbhN (UPF0104 family)
LYRIRPYLRIFGIALSILCLVFVLRRLFRLDQNTVRLILEADIGLTVAAGVFVWLIVHTLLGFGWWRLLDLVGVDCDLGSSMKVALQSQLAKYLPGNVFHLVGSVAMMKLRGHSVRRASSAVALQVVVLAMTAVCLGAPLFLRLSHPMFISGTCLILLSVLSSVGAIRTNRIRNRNRRPTRVLAEMAAIVGATALLLIISGLYVSLLVNALLVDGDHPSFLDSTAAFALSWLSGFLAVGSPGGIGVREYLYASLLSGSWDTGITTLAIVVFRLVTVFADLIAFSLSFCIKEGPPDHGIET